MAYLVGTAAEGAAQLQSETTYTVAADPYLPIQVIEPACGRAASIEEAKARFLANWQKYRADSTPAPRPSI
jgi:hypothetical protein